MKHKIKSKADEPTLEENEEIIARGLEAYREAGLALKRIRDGDQYQQTHKTFAIYCRDRWHMSRAQAYRLIEAAETAENVSDSETPPPATEWVARELKGTPKQKRVVWNKTVKKHGSKPTAEQTRKVAEDENVVDIKTRQQGRHKPKSDRPSITHDARVIEWVWEKTDDGWNRDEIVAASKAGTDGWPLRGESLSNGAVTECNSVIVHLKRLNARPVPAGQRPKPAGPLKKVRKEATGNYGHLLDTQIWMREMTNRISRFNVERLDIDSKDEAVVFTLEDYYDDLIDHGVWVDRTTTSIQARMSDVKVRERIKNLRNTKGFEPPEIPARLAKADELERKLENKLASGDAA